MNGCIYLVENDVNDKKYVGQTTQSIGKRWSEHKDHANHEGRRGHNSLLETAMREIGQEHFTVVELESIESENKEEVHAFLNERERYYISYYDTYYNGYNNTIGGNTVPVLLLDWEGNIVKEYPSIKDASEELDVYREQISMCCSGTVFHTHGYRFCYKHDFENDTIPFDRFETQKEIRIRKAQKRGKRVAKIDPTTEEVIEVYESLHEAGRKNN